MDAGLETQASGIRGYIGTFTGTGDIYTAIITPRLSG